MTLPFGVRTGRAVGGGCAGPERPEAVRRPNYWRGRSSGHPRRASGFNPVLHGRESVAIADDPGQERESPGSDQFRDLVRQRHACKAGGAVGPPVHAERPAGGSRPAACAARSRLPEGRDDLLDEQREGLLLLLVREAVVAPEAVLVDTQVPVVADALDHLVGRADHRRLVQGVELELRAVLELRLWARV